LFLAREILIFVDQAENRPVLSEDYNPMKKSKIFNYIHI